VKSVIDRLQGWIGRLVGEPVHDITHDLFVLDQNLFDIDPHDIHKAKVEMTMMNDVIRHQDGL